MRSTSLSRPPWAAPGLRAPSWQVQDHVDAGRLKLVLQEYERPALPLQMIFLDPRHFSRKVQSFADFLAQQWGGR
jgi:DNA-binding transcriptional LysR family regulator